jgi:uncharacterized protein YlaI
MPKPITQKMCDACGERFYDGYSVGQGPGERAHVYHLCRDCYERRAYQTLQRGNPTGGDRSTQRWNGLSIHRIKRDE